MPAKYFVKRNSLSSKWGVWAVEQSAGSPVENLVAEFKNQSHAETYQERISNGESHTAIMTFINTKPENSSGGGMFSKLFKRDSQAEKPERQVTTNAVIEIQPRKPAAEPRDGGEQELPATPRTARPANAPSRFQFIEPPARPAKPVAVAQSEDKVIAEAPETASTEIEERTGEDTAADPATTVNESAPVVDEPEISEQEAWTTAARLPVGSKRKVDDDDDGVLVDWTFSPPPDVTPDEVRASSQPGASGEQDDDQSAVEPAPVQAGIEEAPVAEEKSSPVAVNYTEHASEQPIADDSVDRADTESRLNVDICVSKALQDSAIGNPKVSDKKYNSIASKEYTEVSKAFANGNSQEHLREELTHLAAVCLAWADAIEKRQTLDMEEKAA